MSLRRDVPRLLTSIHDVTPVHESELRELWAQCRHAGITPALFVVPNWHGAWRLADHPRFVRWIQQCAEAGADVLLHGERHDEVGSPRSMRDHARAVGRTAAEGEFLTLDVWQARERIERGLLYLWSLDLRPIGFVPPAWLAPTETHGVVRDTGLAVSEDVSHVYMHQVTPNATTTLKAPAVRWSGRATWRAHASRAAANWHWHVSRRLGAVRLALHPQDLRHPVTARSVRSAIGDWAGISTRTHYRDLVAT
jgi:predicted deacetylase